MTEILQDRSTEIQASIGAIEDIAVEVRMRVIAQLAAGTGSIEDIVRELAGAVGKKVSFTQGEAEEVQLAMEEAKLERVLAPEVQAVLLGRLQARFDAYPDRHRSVNWADVQASLEASLSLLWSLNEMEKAGHSPDVYSEDEEAYSFGTCSVESPETTRNIVYDAEAQAWLAANHPDAICNGNAVDLADAMGIELMSEAQYKHLQTLGSFDSSSWSWLKTFDAMRKSGLALYGGRRDGNVHVPQNVAYRHRQYGAFRGSIRVPKLKT